MRRAVAGSLAALVGLLAGLSTLRGLEWEAWAVGTTCAVVLAVAVPRGLARGGADHLGPADLVTLGRATVACAVAALVTSSLLGNPATALVVSLSAVALALDAVDGRVARATCRPTRFGAVFDGEADAFLLLVLSVHVAASYGWWVLAIGLARYAFLGAGRVLAWLRRRLPPRYWRKVVTAVQGVVLVTASAQVLPPGPTYAALVAALLLLAESFGRDVWWLWRRRPGRRPEPAGRAPVPDGVLAP